MTRIVAMLATLIAVTPLCAEDAVDYTSQVKPILERHCFACHGSIRKQGGLRLDTVQSMLAGGDSGPAIRPKRPDRSYLLDVVTGEAGFRMPPEGEGEQLTPQQVQLIRSWIEAGAQAPDDEQPQADPREHWSYRPPVRPTVPAIDSDWPRNPVDSFVVAQHSRHGLEPRPEAEPATLLRRVYLDLIGIPPTRAQLHTFLADDRRDAYERVVERLLASPLYGQRWGRHWMDIWRYSDWYGRRPNNEIRYSQRHIWRWRDWIIESVNQDKGYDRMVVEMIAGDEVAPTDDDTLRATGFLGRNWYKFDRNVWLFETVEQTSKGLMALTMRCARCHDHKFDPVSQQEYYELRACFEPHSTRIDRLDGSAATVVNNKQGTVLADGLARVYDASPDAETYLFLRGDDRRPDREHPLQPGIPAALGGQLDIKAVSLPPASYIPALRAAEADSMLAAAQQSVEQAESALQEARRTWDDAKLRLSELRQSQSDATDESPDFFLTDAFDASRPKVWKQLSGKWNYADGKLIESSVSSFATIVTLENHPRDFQARLRYRTLKPGGYRSVGLSFDWVDAGNSQDVYTSISAKSGRQTVQAFHRQGGKQVYPAAGIVPAELSVGQELTLKVQVQGAQLRIVLDGQGRLDYKLPLERREGKFALWVHDGSAEFLDLSIRELAPTVESLDAAAAAAERAVQMAERRAAVARRELTALRARIEAERSRHSDPPDGRHPELAAVASQAERAVAVAQVELSLAALVSQRDTSPEAAGQLADAEAKLVAARRQLAEPSEQYEPFEAQYPKASTGRRLALARWLTRGDHPRTARVAVNHIWTRHFDRPLVEPVDDFGPRSRPRSHPDLLDWLAVEFVEHGWSMKHLHRLIVTSSTYRMQSSAGDDAAELRVDPENRYIWHMPSRRMEAEVVRDSLLACAGQLDVTFGGPELDEQQGQSSPRRSMYFRTTPDNKMEMLELFDLANPNECYRRRVSVVPQQALALANSQLALSQSRIVGQQLSTEVGNASDRATAFIVAAFELILTRRPTAEERSVCEQFLVRQTDLLSDPATLSKYPATSGQTAIAPSADPHLRARENLVHVLLNHNDFVTIR